MPKWPLVLLTRAPQFSLKEEDSTGALRHTSGEKGILERYSWDYLLHVKVKLGIVFENVSFETWRLLLINELLPLAPTRTYGIYCTYCTPSISELLYSMCVYIQYSKCSTNHQNNRD